jgi:hypothetical protein
MTLSTLHAALARVNAQIAAAPNSVAMGGLLLVRASLIERIREYGR